MGILDFLKASELKKRIAELEAKLLPEQRDIEKLTIQLAALNTEMEQSRTAMTSELEKCKNTISMLKNQITLLDQEIHLKKSQIVELDETINIQEFGIYTPLYAALSSQDIKDRIEKCRDKQKEMITQDSACSYAAGWTVNGSVVEGRKMMKNNVKQILRGFNTECESIIDKVKFNNYTAISDRIVRSWEALNKMNVSVSLSINMAYLDLKIEELRLVHEYAIQKEKEKEAEIQRRDELREQKKLEMEIKRAKEKIQKEEDHFANALEELRLKVNSAGDETQKQKYLDRIAELESELVEIRKKKEDIDYREKNTRAGYVYVISNLGAFGENVYKIGVTRRLDPNERIRELGDASVPFKFDTHCLVFSDDAPKLEAALHKAFDEMKLNRVNMHREFFRVTLEEIEKVIRANFNDTFDMKAIPDAEEYRISEKVRRKEIPQAAVVTSNESIIDSDVDEPDVLT